MTLVKLGPPPIRIRVAVIYNPTAGFFQRGRLRRFLKHLRARGHIVLLRRTEGPDHATRIAAELDPDAVDVVVAAGGDGTINEVANGLIGRAIPMSIAPLGTANILALELGMELTMKRAASLLTDGYIAEIRPALVNGRGFLLMVSAGPDARVVSKINAGLKRVIGKGAYVVAALAEVFGSRGARIQVCIDGTRYDAGLVIVTHVGLYAGPFLIAPDARLGDEAVTVVLLDGRSRWSMFRYAAALITNRLSRMSDVRVLRGSQVSIGGPEGEPIQSDGDPIGVVPMEITPGAATLRLLVPNLGRVQSVLPFSAKPETPEIMASNTKMPFPASP